MEKVREVAADLRAAEACVGAFLADARTASSDVPTADLKSAFSSIASPA
jgi:hypothetical protein